MTRIVLCLVFCSIASPAATEVRLRSAASCPATVVRLGDLAEIASEDPAVASDLAAIALFPAPPAGASRQLDRHQVRQLLAISGIDLAKVTIGGSEAVIVQSAATPT